MSLNKIWFLVLIVAATLSGCSSTSDNGINYRESVITPTLEMPPDLVTPAADRNLELPGSKVGKPANSGRFVETGNLNATARTLPKIDGIRIHREGGVYWLSVKRPAGELYPQVKNFWAEQGFRLVKDEPLLGIQETEWLSLKAGNDSFFASIMASMRAAEARDQYLTRIEADGKNGARIFIAHRGQELVIDEKADALDNFRLKEGWQFVPTDSAKEVEMLSRLMVFLGAQDAQVEQQIASLGSLQARARLELNRDDQPYVLVQGGLQQTLNRLRYRMDKLAIPLSDIEQSERQATVRLDSQALLDLAVLKQMELPSVGLRLESSANSNTTSIEVLGKSGSSVHDGAATAVMNFLVEQLR